MMYDLYLPLFPLRTPGVDLYWLREAELEHCRVAMLAVVGLLYTFPCSLCAQQAWTCTGCARPS